MTKTFHDQTNLWILVLRKNIIVMTWVKFLLLRILVLRMNTILWKNIIIITWPKSFRFHNKNKNLGIEKEHYYVVEPTLTQHLWACQGMNGTVGRTSRCSRGRCRHPVDCPVLGSRLDISSADCSPRSPGIKYTHCHQMYVLCSSMCQSAFKSVSLLRLCESSLVQSLGSLQRFSFRFKYSFIFLTSSVKHGALPVLVPQVHMGPQFLWPQSLWPSQSLWPQSLWPQCLWPPVLVAPVLVALPVLMIPHPPFMYENQSL